MQKLICISSKLEIFKFIQSSFRSLQEKFLLSKKTGMPNLDADFYNSISISCIAEIRATFTVFCMKNIFH